MTAGTVAIQPPSGPRTAVYVEPLDDRWTYTFTVEVDDDLPAGVQVRALRAIADELEAEA